MSVGVKHDQEKDPWHLLPTRALRLVVKVLGYGARKYSVGNWRRIDGWRERYYSATLRHLTAWLDGEWLDPESQLPHLAHATSCLIFLLTLDDEAREIQRDEKCPASTGAHRTTC